ncbi:hypothetical protein pqer_cds_878 [Pandoravirus quercus]|uniref:F-box domain containing protein n=1 Tax=Pandoravirus quercus TaxID=2107709 RepID=A0A2U7UA97_9VIRU|nr:hypothetical protein pqer_cds_878 [Pandoravirus quercus]AVK75300.1 hypothetical protein pqer_cds_878 [Pandoravirus quercus]
MLSTEIVCAILHFTDRRTLLDCRRACHAMDEIITSRWFWKRRLLPGIDHGSTESALIHPYILCFYIRTDDAFAAVLKRAHLNRDAIAKVDVLHVGIRTDRDAYVMGAHVWIKNTSKHAIISKIIDTPCGPEFYVCEPRADAPLSIRKWAGDDFESWCVVVYDPRGDPVTAVSMLRQWPAILNWTAAEIVIFCRSLSVVKKATTKGDGIDIVAVNDLERNPSNHT